MSKYTTGELAKLCCVTVRTVQYYDIHVGYSHQVSLLRVADDSTTTMISKNLRLYVF